MRRPLPATVVTDLATALHQTETVGPFGAQRHPEVLALLLDPDHGAPGIAPATVGRQDEHVALKGEAAIAKVRARGLEHEVGAGRGALHEGGGAQVPALSRESVLTAGHAARNDRPGSHDTGAERLFLLRGRLCIEVQA